MDQLENLSSHPLPGLDSRNALRAVRDRFPVHRIILKIKNNILQVVPHTRDISLTALSSFPKSASGSGCDDKFLELAQISAKSMVLRAICHLRVVWW